MIPAAAAHVNSPHTHTLTHKDTHTQSHLLIAPFPSLCFALPSLSSHIDSLKQLRDTSDSRLHAKKHKNKHTCTRAHTCANREVHMLPNSATHRDNLLLVRAVAYWLEPCWRANLKNKAAVRLHCGLSFTLIAMIGPRYVLVSCSVTLPGRVPYGLSLCCML